MPKINVKSYVKIFCFWLFFKGGVMRVPLVESGYYCFHIEYTMLTNPETRNPPGPYDMTFAPNFTSTYSRCSGLGQWRLVCDDSYDDVWHHSSSSGYFDILILRRMTSRLWGAACCCCCSCSCCWNLYQGFINWGLKIILVYFLCC